MHTLSLHDALPIFNTYFFLIFDNKKKILNTIKSRCFEFKISFSKTEKDKIFTNLLKNHNINDINVETYNLLNYDSPGNILNYIISLGDSYSDLSKFESDFIIKCIKKRRQCKISTIKVKYYSFYEGRGR